jgi:hypothetical protein
MAEIWLYEGEAVSARTALTFPFVFLLDDDSGKGIGFLENGLVLNESCLDSGGNRDGIANGDSNTCLLAEGKHVCF